MAITLKHVVARCLPAPLRQAVRRWYYPRLVGRFAPDWWPPAAGVRRLVKPGDVVVDAGANIGYVTALLARWVGPTGRVHSFEPVPVTADLLRRAIARAGFKHVQIHACGVSSETGVATMHIPQYADGGENLYESRVVSASETADEAGTIRIPLCRMDEALAADIPRITFIKIDVEGHEESALKGAAAILEQARPALLIEIMGDLDDPRSSAGRVLLHLQALGYAPYLWDGHWRPRLVGEKAVDYYFLTRHHLESCP